MGTAAYQNSGRSLYLLNSILAALPRSGVRSLAAFAFRIRAMIWVWKIRFLICRLKLGFVGNSPMMIWS